MKQTNSICIYNIIIFICVLICIVIVSIFFNPYNSIKRNLKLNFDEEIIRSSSTSFVEIKKLIDKPDYQLALDRTKRELNHSDMELKELDDASYVWSDDEMKYEEEAELQMNSELRWIYIYLLVQTDDIKEAKKQLKVYLKRPENATHLSEAKSLSKSLSVK